VTVELPPGVKYRLYKTKKYTIYYLMDDIEIGNNFDKKIVRGDHEFYFFGNLVVVKPVRATSQVREGLST
jgi:hypothetical protein